MPIYTDKRTGKKVIQYQIGYRYVPDKSRPGHLKKKPKYKTEVVGRSARVAKKLLAQREAEWLVRRCEEQEAPQIKARYTFPELVSWYLSLPVTRKKKTYDKDVQRSDFLLNYFGEMKADMIKPSMVESFQYQMSQTKSARGRNYSNATINRAVAMLKRMYNLAIREDMVIKNPCWKVAMLPEKPRDRVLSADEYERLFVELSPRIKPIVKVAFNTGMRCGEILNLTWDRVDLAKGFIDLRAEDTKTSEPRRVYMNEEVKNLVEDAGKVRSLNHDYVFIHKGKRIKYISVGFKNAVERAGLGDFRFHDLRHTFVTIARKAGVPQSVIMKMTGHKTAAMFHRYNNVDDEDLVVAVSSLSGYFGTIFSSKSSDIVQTDAENSLNLRKC